MRLCLVFLVAAACRPPGYGRDEKPDAPSATDAGPTSDAAIDTPAGPTCDHPFRLDGHGTDASVWLTGDFVQWAATPLAGAIEFTLGGDGGWTGSYAFTGGSHQYKFIVNGSDWILDPTNPTTIDDGMGHTNNVYTCVP